MRPPICVVCSKRFLEKGGMVQFKLTEKEKESSKKFKMSGFIGHPIGLEWFCEKHIDEAKRLSHLTLADALKIMRKKH